ncbi:Ig-like domain-containing protein [Deinococcus koreensis]|nr:Ig-like domain-containing protein [Deinococcus koreensis]
MTRRRIPFLTGLTALLLSACAGTPPPLDSADTAGPTVELTAVTTAATTGAVLVLNARASDPSGVREVVFSLDGVEVARDAEAPFTADVPVASITVGPHLASAVAQDRLGNTTAVTAEVLVRDPAVTSTFSLVGTVDRWTGGAATLQIQSFALLAWTKEIVPSYRVLLRPFSTAGIDAGGQFSGALLAVPAGDLQPVMGTFTSSGGETCGSQLLVSDPDARATSLVVSAPGRGIVQPLSPDGSTKGILVFVDRDVTVSGTCDRLDVDWQLKAGFNSTTFRASTNATTGATFYRFRSEPLPSSIWTDRGGF